LERDWREEEKKKVPVLEKIDEGRQKEFDKLQEKVYLLESQVGGRASILVGIL